MKEEFVTYHQAVALYNLDFDWDCEQAYYDHAWISDHRIVPYAIAAKEQRDYDGTDVYSAPAQALAQKWLREVKRLTVVIYPSTDYDDTSYEPFLDGTWFYELWVEEKRISLKETASIDYPTYEAALSAGLDAALGLITKK